MTALPHQIHRAKGTVKVTDKHRERVKAAQKREKKKAATRSPKWRTVRKRHLQKNPECAACGARRGLQVHHVVPFHVDKALELDPKNLLTLCEYVGGLECHEFLGHGDHWQSYNPLVREHVAELRQKPESLTAIRSVAKKNRIKQPKSAEESKS